MQCNLGHRQTALSTQKDTAIDVSREELEGWEWMDELDERFHLTM